MRVFTSFGWLWAMPAILCLGLFTLEFIGKEEMVGENGDINLAFEQIEVEDEKFLSCPQITDVFTTINFPDNCAGIPGNFTIELSDPSLIPFMEFRISGSNWQIGNNVFNYYNEGVYLVEIRGAIDGKDCYLSYDQLLPGSDTDPPPSISLSSQDVSSCGGSDGSITVSASGGNPPYEYRLGSGSWQTNNSFTRLSTGNYTVYVRNQADGCTTQQTVTVSGPAPAPTIDGYDKTTMKFCEYSAAQVTVYASGGTPPYEYRMDGGGWQSSNVFTNVSQGWKDVEVRNASGGCIASGGTMVGKQDAPSIDLLHVDDVSFCGASDGRIIILASSNDAEGVVSGNIVYKDLEYSINEGSTWFSSNTFSNLSGGSYPVAVRYAGEPCKITQTVTVGEPAGCGEEVCDDGLDNDGDGLIDSADPDCCPVAGTPCDDGNPGTYNDVEDGACNCAGTPCPAAGTACDDGNSTTYNDQQDGSCNCVGTPCPAAGTACDDGDPNTINDVEDGNCNCAGEPAGADADVWLEAECGILGGNWSSVADQNASEGFYLLPPAGNTYLDTPPSSAADQVYWEFDLVQGGTFTMYFRAMATNGGDDSFWVQVDDNAWIKFNAINNHNYGPIYQWAAVGHWTGGGPPPAASFDLAAGRHTLRVAVREPGARLDKIHLTATTDAPQGLGQPAGSPCPADCEPLQNLRLSKAGVDFLDVAWQAPPAFTPEAYAVRHKLRSDAGFGAAVTVADTGYSLTGLLEDTIYQLEVCYTCAYFGTFCDTLEARTLPGCEPPASARVDGTTQNSIALSWTLAPGTPPDGPFLVRYKDAGVRGDFFQDTVVTDTAVLLTELSNETNYDVELCMSCPDGTGDCIALQAFTSCPAAGTPCDDGDPNTINDVADGNCNCVSEPGFSAWLEAECGNYRDSWTLVQNPDASNGWSLAPPDNLNSTGAPPADANDWVSWNFNVPADGTYYIYGRTVAPSGSDDSFWVRVDGGAWIRWNFINQYNISSTLQWDAVGETQGADGLIPAAFDLQSGSHTLTIAYREDGIQLDKWMIANAPQRPAGTGDPAAITCAPCLPAGTPCNDGDPGTINDQFDDACNCRGDSVEIWLEAECGLPGANWSTVSDAEASAGYYLLPPDGSNFLDTPPASADDQIYWAFDITHPATYTLFLRAMTTGGTEDSFWVQVDDGAWIKFNMINAGNYGPVYQWAAAGHWTGGGAPPPAAFDLSAGRHTLRIAAREPGARLDKINLTLGTDPPQGAGSPAEGPCPEDCQTPQNLRLLTAVADSLTVAWDAPAAYAPDAYALRYKLKGAADYSPADTLPGNQHTLTGLLPDTAYTVQVCYECAYFGTVCDSLEARTLRPCEAPLNIRVDSAAHDALTLSWTMPRESQFSGPFTVYYKPAGNTNYQNTVVTDTTVQLTELLPQTTYELQICYSCPGNSEACLSLQATTPCPPAGTACDDGDTATYNDVADGNCGCAGIPCPPAGTACDDGDPGTYNDITDGNCGCAGEPCPPAGTACDDGDPGTVFDTEDGNCNCAGVRANVYLEAECGVIGTEWEIELDPEASGGRVLRPPNKTSHDNPPLNSEDQVTWQFEVPVEGTYRVLGRTQTTQAGADSYWVRVDSSAWMKWNNINASDSAYHWEQAGHWTSGASSTPQSFLLSPGVHTLTVAWREPGVQLDKWFLVQTDEMPEGRGGLPIEECPDGMAGPDPSICPGTCTEIGMEPDPDHPEYCYTWMPQEGVESPYSSKTRVCPLQTTTYTLHITNDDGELIGSDEVTVEVQSAAEVAISASETLICDGQPSILITGQTYDSYAWSTGEVTQAIVVQEPGVYTVTVTPTDGCELTGSVEIKGAANIDIPIEPTPAILCAGQDLELSAVNNPDYSYQWTTSGGSFSSTQSPRTILVNSVGTYQVNVTHSNGCQSTGSIEVTDQENPEGVRDLLLQEGFTCIPVTIDVPALQSPGVDFREGDPLVENLAPGLQFSFSSLTGGESVTTETLTTLIESRFAGPMTCSANSRGLITDDASFCDPEFYQLKKGDFTDSELGIWMHLWDGAGTDDCLYVKVFDAGEPSTTTQSLTELFNAAKDDPDTYGWASKTEHLLNFTLNHTLSSFSDTIPQSIEVNNILQNRLIYGPAFNECDYDKVVVGLAPSGLPVWIPQGSRLGFGTIEKYRDQIDQRAVTRFTIENGENKGTWRAAVCNGQFLGYYNVNKEEPYSFDVSQLSSVAALNNGDLLVQLGTFIPDPCPNTRVEVEIAKVSSFAGANANAAGPFVAEFTNYESYHTRQTYTAFYCQAAISDAEFNKPFMVDLNPHNRPEGDNGVLGWLVGVKNIEGGIDWIYGSIANEGVITYQRYGCTGWEPYEPPAYPEWYTMNAFMGALLKIVQENARPVGHFALDVGSLVFDPLDYVQAVWYTSEGNAEEAALVMATSPVATDVVYTAGKYLVKAGKKTYELLGFLIRYTDDAGNLVANALLLKDFLKHADAVGLSHNQKEKLLKLLHEIQETHSDIVNKFWEDPGFHEIWKYADEAGLEDAQLTKLFDDLVQDADLAESFKTEPRLVKAWEILENAGYSDLRKNTISLRKLNDLILNPNLTNSGLSENSVRRLIKGNRDGGASAAALDDLTDGLNSLLNSGAIFNNYGRLLTDLEKGRGFTEGATWVQRYVIENTFEFAGKNLEFEINVVTGRVDLRVGSILYEFKSVASLPPQHFLNQMTRDLNNASNLSEIKWIFNGDKLPNGITQIDKEAMLNELGNMDLPSEVISRFVPNGNIDDLILLIEDSFNSIFLVR